MVTGLSLLAEGGCPLPLEELHGTLPVRPRVGRFIDQIHLGQRHETLQGHRCSGLKRPALGAWQELLVPQNPPVSPSTSTVLPMPIVPRWRYMTDEAKALTKRTAVSALVVLVVLLVFRSLVPWVLVAIAAWWIWKAISR